MLWSSGLFCFFLFNPAPPREGAPPCRATTAATKRARECNARAKSVRRSRAQKTFDGSMRAFLVAALCTYLRIRADCACALAKMNRVCISGNCVYTCKREMLERRKMKKNEKSEKKFVFSENCCIFVLVLCYTISSMLTVG